MRQREKEKREKGRVGGQMKETEKGFKKKRKYLVRHLEGQARWQKG